jgi:hypothetical protein
MRFPRAASGVAYRQPAFRILSAVLILLGFFAISASADSQTSLDADKASDVKGQIPELSTTLPPLGAKLAPGNKFNESLFPACKEKNEWVKIPIWLAGTWDPDNEAPPPVRGPKEDQKESPHHSGEEAWSCAKLDFSHLESFGSRGLNGFIGCQKDKAGDIWERSYIVHRTDNDECGYHSQDLWEIAYISPEKVVARNRIIVVKTDEDEIVKASGQAEHLYTYTPAGDGAVRLTVATRSYNAKGLPGKNYQHSRIEQLISDFHVINDFESDNLSKLFSQFLHQSGLAKLVPDSPDG